MKTDLPPLSKHLLKDSWVLIPGRTHEGRQGHKQECENVPALREHIACFSEAQGDNPMEGLSGESICFQTVPQRMSHILERRGRKALSLLS